MWKKANRLKSTTFLDSFNSACFYEIFFLKQQTFPFLHPNFGFQRRNALIFFVDRCI